MLVLRVCLGVRFKYFLKKKPSCQGCSFLFELLFGWTTGGDGGGWWPVVGEKRRLVVVVLVAVDFDVSD